MPTHGMFMPASRFYIQRLLSLMDGARLVPLRFLAVVVMGLGVDLGLAWTLAVVFFVPLTIAAVCGFLIGALFNYVLHESWTFKMNAIEVASKRFIRYLVSLGITLGFRVGAVAVLGIVIGDLFGHGRREAVVLFLATGVSFVVNFIGSKYFVFVDRDRKISAGASLLSIGGVMTSQVDAGPSSEWQIPSYLEEIYGPVGSKYALVIPVINEGERVRAQLQRIKEAKLPVDIVVADGGSTDGSLDAEYMRQSSVRAVLTKTAPGKLSAQLRIAYSWCLRQGYQGIVTVDGNGKDGVEAVAEFVNRLIEGYDYIQGSRYRCGGIAENTPLERTIGNRFIHAPLLSLAGRHWLTDTTNGFRGYSARYLLDPRVAPFRDIFNRYELLFYLSVRAGQLGYRICEVPVRRSYPRGEAVPTKISGTGAKAALLGQTVKAAIGRYKP